MIKIDGNSLNISDVISVSREGVQVELDPAACQKMTQSENWVKQIAINDTPVYGINTGFGNFSDRHISPNDLIKLNRNLILSHAVAVGPALPDEVTRAAMLIRANTLANGNSGVRPLVVETILQMLNKNVIPVIPSQGSLGSSGDLALLSHLTLTFTRDANDSEKDSGMVKLNNNFISGKKGMKEAGIQRLVLQAKEGLALNNGATFTTALAALVVGDSADLLKLSEIALAMSLEALQGNRNAFDHRIHHLRGHPGQIAVARYIRHLVRGSTLLDSTNRVQDAYSLRCAPQVQGAARDSHDHVSAVISREINAVTDNPLIFGPEEAISGGNFHGEPIGIVMDFLGISIAEVGAISERRTNRLIDSKLNSGLPPMLVDNHEIAGLNSGMMMPHYTAAALVLENKSLAGPDSVHSLPTSANQEDHNANSYTAAKHARTITENAAYILAIEIYCAARALDIRLNKLPEAQLGKGTSAAHNKIRRILPYQINDVWMNPEIEKIHKLILSKDYLSIHPE